MISPVDIAAVTEARERALPPEWFTSQAFYDFEWSAVFERNWFCVGRDSDVPHSGDFTTLQVGDEPLLLVRGDDERVRVLSNVCQHRGMVIAEARGNHRLLRCPFHAWTYRLDGQLVTAPGMEDVEGFDCCSVRLPEIRSEGWCGFRFATFASEIEPVADRLAPLAASLEPYQVAELRSAAPLSFTPYDWNWKLFSDECYHCVHLHARSWHRMFPVPPSRVDCSSGLTDVERGIIEYRLLGSGPDASPTRTGKALHPILPRLSVEERSVLRYITVMPNLLIIGMPDKVKYFLWLPTGPSSSLFGVSWLFPALTMEDPSFAETWTMERDDLAPVMEEDIQAWSGVQRGLRSRFAPRGRLAPNEVVVAEFNEWLVRQFQAAAAADG